MRDTEYLMPSGRVVRLRELRQCETYEGLLEGVPTAERNKAIIERLIASYRREDSVPYLVQPQEKIIAYPDYPFGTPSALPAVTCMGRFTSLAPARDQTKDYSTLTIIWFQESFALPIEPDILEAILGINWEQLAIDFEY